MNFSYKTTTHPNGEQELTITVDDEANMSEALHRVNSMLNFQALCKHLYQTPTTRPEW